MVEAALAEESVCDDAVYIELVEDGVGVLGTVRRGIFVEKNTDLAKTSSEYDDLVYLAHLLEKIVYAGSF